MVVKLRFRLGAKTALATRNLALAAAAVLTPSAVMAFVLGCWRIGADLKWTGAFMLDSGFFSHWQVWMAAATLLQSCAVLLDRYGRAADTAATANVERSPAESRGMFSEF